MYSFVFANFPIPFDSSHLVAESIMNPTYPVVAFSLFPRFLYFQG